MTPAVTGLAAEAATETLWALSGRRYGTCTGDFRPCLQGCGAPSTLSWADDSFGFVRPELVDGVWINIACGYCHGDCSCGHVSRVTLPQRLVSVESVVVDGVTLPSSAYRLEGDHRSLVRLDGSGWPRCQDWNAAKDDEGAWYIRGQWGTPVPRLGILAVSELASEILKSCQGLDCALPSRVTEVSRNGLTILLDSMEFLKEGKTGLYACDLFLQSVNPHKRPSRSRVYSPDRMPGRSA